MAIEDAHQPGAERTALLEARESTPGQQKGSLRYILRQRALGLPEVPERLLVSSLQAARSMNVSSQVVTHVLLL